MSSLYIKEGNAFFVTSDAKLDLHKILPPKTYVVSLHPQRGFYLDTVENMSLPSKIYGDSTKNRDRIMDTFKDRPAGTGVLLTGEKGSGKTLLTKSLSILGLSQGIPTILVNAPYHGDAFNKFIQGIEQPCIMVFDEFEKVFDKDEQKSLLTLFDGTFASKKLFLLTVNNNYIDVNMQNRPGRLYYVIHYEGLDEAFIREYCEDNLNEKGHINSILIYTKMFMSFNFDMLKALVEEMNRYGETPSQASRILNTRPEFSRMENEYKMKLTINRQEVEILYDDKWEGNPYTEALTVCHDPDPKNDEQAVLNFDFGPEKIVKLDPNGRVTYELPEKNAVLILTRHYEARHDITRLL